MNDKKFLQYALEQSFDHPLSDNCSGLQFVDCTALSDCLLIKDIHHCSLPAYLLPNKNILHYMQLCKSEAKNNRLLNDQLQIFKHDVTENIIIPENISQIKEIRTEFDMPVVNRQAARKKQMVATIIHSVFMEKISQITEQYRLISAKIEQRLAAQPDFFDLVQVHNFALQYRKITRKFHGSHLIFWLNKKRFISYLCEAIQLLKYRPTLAEDFCTTHQFIGQHCPWSANSAKHCMLRLQILLEILQTMAQKPQILQLAQTAIADYKTYRQKLQKYQISKDGLQRQKAEQIYSAWQQCFEKYAYIRYLDGVRQAFEHKFLDECPLMRNPSLPTVSPQEELKKILKIVTQSKKTIPYNGKINRLYDAALSSWEQAISNLSSFFD